MCMERVNTNAIIEWVKMDSNTRSTDCIDFRLLVPQISVYGWLSSAGKIGSQKRKIIFITTLPIQSALFNPLCYLFLG